MSPIRLPKPRPDMAAFQAYRTQQMKADVRIQANEWAEPNPASAYLSAGELGNVLLNRYPGANTELRDALAERFKVSGEQLIFGNGSNEVLLYTFLLFGGHDRPTLVFDPTYSMHTRLAQIAGGPVVSEVVGLPYEVTKARALDAMARAKPNVVVFCTPNNPTGNLIDDDVILSVAERHPDTLVLVDEAYSDFSGTTLLPAIAAHPNIVISKTFSKARAAAGLRLGVLVVDEGVAGIFRAVQLPYNVSTLTNAVAGRIARDDAGIARRTATLKVERERVHAALAGTAALTVYPSVTNFILFKTPDGDAAKWHARILEHGVLIRDISSWPACAGCLRVSIGTHEENSRFIDALEAVFGATRTGAPATGAKA